jgi:hypothetical protein
MSWKEDNALDKILNVFKRFKEQKGKIYDNDIEALRTLKEASVNRSETHVNDNILFAKLLAIQLRQEIDYFGDVQMAIKSISANLGEPMGYHIEKLRMQINNTADINHFKSIGIDISLDTKAARQEHKNILESEQKEFFNKISNYWNYEKVSSSFYNTANDLLKDLNNYS